MFNKKANSIIFSLVSLISLSIGGLFGFAYVQFWSNSAKKRTDFDNKEWELLAESALSTELDYLQNETLHSQFITNISNKLSPLPKITLSPLVIIALRTFFDDSHFEEPGVFNLNGLYNFSKFESIFSKFKNIYSWFKPFIDNEIDKISLLPQPIKEDFKNFLQFQNLDNFLKYLSSVFPDDFYLKFKEQSSEFNLQNILLDNIKKNKTLENTQFTHTDNSIQVSHTFNFASFKNFINILDKNQNPIDYPKIIDDRVFSFTLFVGFYFDLNLKIVKKVPHSEGFEFIKKF